VIGSHMSYDVPTISPRYPSRATPITVIGTSLMEIFLPTTERSPPKRRVQ
jgi:hypothetical protein